MSPDLARRVAQLNRLDSAAAQPAPRPQPKRDPEPARTTPKRTR